MSLFRTLALVVIVIAFIPSDKVQQERFLQSALDMAYWTMTFCERNAKTCHIAQISWKEFKQKAQFALDVGHEVLLQQLFAKKIGVTEEALNSNKNKKTVNVGTLQASDFLPEWRQNSPRKDIKVGLNLSSQ